MLRVGFFTEAHKLSCGRSHPIEKPPCSRSLSRGTPALTPTPSRDSLASPSGRCLALSLPSPGKEPPSFGSLICWWWRLTIAALMSALHHDKWGPLSTPCSFLPAVVIRYLPSVGTGGIIKACCSKVGRAGVSPLWVGFGP